MMTPAIPPDSDEEPDSHTLHHIRRKFQIVFGNRCIPGDDFLRKHYRVSPDGDLIMIIS